MRWRWAASIRHAAFILVLVALMAHKIHAFSAMNELRYDPNMKTKIASSVAKTERREAERARVGRETCERCARPPILCVCQSLPEELISTSTSILILQHPRERRRRSLSTVPLMPLVLDKCTVKVGFSFTPDELDIFRESVARGKKPLLLYPGPDAISLDGDDCNDNVVKDLQSEDQLLVLLDGTWNEAKGIALKSPELVQNCRQIQFQSDQDSIYPDVLRKEPQKHCLSTLESCAHALMLLEPSHELATKAKAHLEDSMRCMVEKRMSLIESRNEPRFARPSQKIFSKNKRRHEIKKELFG